MKRIPPLTVACAVIGATGVAADNYKVQCTLNLTTPSAEVWNLTGDFCDVDDWHPGITACQLRVIDGRLHRILSLNGGGELLERRIASEPGLTYTYRVTGGPFAADKLIMTFSVEPIGGTRIDWIANFSADDLATEARIAAFIEAGLAGIKGKVAPE